MHPVERRIEELVREEISIVPYDSEWPRMFELEAANLRSLIPAGLAGRIEHFGSTAVPGLAAKPIVDILVEVRSLSEARDAIAPILQSTGAYEYFWRTDVSPPYAWFIKRDPQGRRTHHIHMVENESRLWERLLFRDYLREFPEEAFRYEQLKRELAGRHSADRISYTNAKAEFIMSLTQRARQYYGAQPIR